jgi:hypothetical protein
MKEIIDKPQVQPMGTRLPTQSSVEDPMADDAQRMRVTCLRVAVVLGAVWAWATRFSMNPDGVTYLDLSDAFRHHDWGLAINGYWSPLYPLLLCLFNAVVRPSSYWEFPVTHLVNFVIYLGALVAFDHFFRKVTAWRSIPSHWAWQLFGYSLFTWSTFALIGIDSVAPDLLVAAFTYYIAALLTRIRMGDKRWSTSALLGVALGMGYWAKAAMFPLAFIFLLVSFFAFGRSRTAFARVALAAVCFFAISSPLVFILSQRYGHLTLGESGRIAYANYNNAPMDPGLYKHLPKTISENPVAYDFGFRVRATYPLWADGAYYAEGLKVHFDLGRQFKVLLASTSAYFYMFIFWQAALVAGILVLFLSSNEKRKILAEVKEHWHLLIPPIAAICMYALVYVESRYVCAGIVILWISLFSALRVSERKEGVSTPVVLMMVMMLGTYLIWTLARDLSGSQRHPDWDTAGELHLMGINEGDKVSVLGDRSHLNWARLAHVYIVSGIPADQVPVFWAASPELRYKVIDSLKLTGVKFIVADHVPSTASADWRRIGNSDHWIFSPHID